MRPGEKDGDTYNFITKSEFEKGIEENDFLEYEINHKVAYYGTKKSEVEAGLQAGNTLMKEIDTKGLKQLHDKHPDFKDNYTSFFLDVPDDVLKERFFQRNPEGSIEDFKNRVASTIIERKQAEEYCDYIIDATQVPSKVLEEVLHIMKV